MAFFPPPPPEVQALLLDEVLLLLQRVEERLVLRPHSRGPAPPDGRRLLSPIVPLRSAMARQVATGGRGRALFGQRGAGRWPSMGIGGGVVALYGHRGRGGGLMWALWAGRWPSIGIEGRVVAAYGQRGAGRWPYMGVGAGLWPSMGVAECRSNMGVGVMVLYGHWGAGLWPYMGIGGGAVALHGHRGRGGGLIWAL